jgi:alkylhydroperoxidase family enzyme
VPPRLPALKEPLSSPTTAADVRALREAGFEDPAIHDICAIVAYFAFVNRLADGLGVELEARFGRATAAP